MILHFKHYWNNLPLRAKGFAVISIPVLALLITLGVTHSFRRYYYESEERVRHTVEVSAEIQRTYRLVYEGSAGIRGYILTNKESFLEPYQEALLGLPQSLSNLSMMVRDNSIQAERVRRVKSLVRRLSEGWEELRTAVQQVPTNAQRIEVLTTESIGALLVQNKMQSDALRGIFDDMQVEEERLLRMRAQRAQNVAELEFAVVGLSALFGLIGGLVALNIFTKSILSRIQRLKTNATNLALGQPLQQPPSGKDEIGLLGEELDKASVARFSLERDLRERNIELEHLNSLKKDFLANTSHELRTPLTAIIGFSELLSLKVFGELNERQEQYVKDIYDSGHHLLSLINDILDLSKIEAGKMELKLQLINVASLAEGALIVIKERAQKAGLDVSTELSPGLSQLQIQADARRLKQVLYNLLSNAVKFTPQGGTVVLKVTTSSSHVRFEVNDSGIGIPPEEQKKLFKEFSQIDSSLSREQEGTGLGLALCKHLVELHGGNIWVKSEPGKGSTFGFSIPSEQYVKQVPEMVTEINSPRKGRCILIVENDDAMANLLQVSLEQEGYCTIRARNGEEGLDLLKQHQPLAVTLDLMMPVMGGYDFLQALTTDPKFLRTPIVIISAAEDAECSYAFGVTAVLSKPINRDALSQALREVVGTSIASQKILVVDDDPIVLSMLSDQLRSLNYDVIVATNGQEALKILEDQRPHLLILDLLMPKMNGFDLVEVLRKSEALRSLPVMVLTSLDLNEKDRGFLEKHARSITEKKHFDLEAFKKEIQRIVTYL